MGAGRGRFPSMAKRLKLETVPQGGAYFAPPERVETFGSGCTLLDCVLGGGWPIGRIANIVGDKSTGKTLLAIEACANFASQYPSGKIYYAEAEAAFDKGYAHALGLPTERVTFSHPLTVEDFFESLVSIVAEVGNYPSLVILDSLDALSDRSELERDIDAGSFGANKAKKLSELFRRTVQNLEGKKTTVFIISQVRENIGVTFGKTLTRSGGRALDFYASQVLWLAPRGQLKKTKKNVERTIGVNVRAKCEKNKIGYPFRECEFPIIFSFGVEDVVAGVEWLISVKRSNMLFDSDEDAKKFVSKIDRLDAAQYAVERAAVSEAVRSVWAEIETEFMPRRKKYS